MKSFTLGLTENELKSLRHIAAERGQSMSSIVRSMIRREIAGYVAVKLTGRPRLVVIDGGAQESDTPIAKAE